MKKPNILFIFADQMRGSAMGCADEKVYTPNLDKFASEGTRFTRAVSNTPVCGPVRASIMTGLHTLHHRLVNNDKEIETDFNTLAGCLSQNGYDCGYIGKWHMGPADRGAFIPPGPKRLGFDDYWASYNCNHRYFDGYYYLDDNPDPVWIDGYEPFGQARLASEYIRKKSKDDKPYCMFLSFGPPHCPYKEVPQKYKDMYPEDEIIPRPNAAPNADKSIISGYYAHITALDECFGNIMKTLDETGTAENTLVIFTSDHGDMLFSQDRGWKCKPWAESVIVPFIVRLPGQVPRGRTTGRLISLVDIMPTLLGISGTEIPEGIDGRDMSRLLMGHEDDTQESVFINYPVSPSKFSYPEWRGVLTERYTYARFREEPWVLYDDSADPYQMENLANSEGNESLKSDMDSLLNEWLGKLGDPFEPTEMVVEKYYRESINGVMPYYQNEKISKVMDRRKRERENE
jgi:arylsulfatase A-like enzyme